LIFALRLFIRCGKQKTFLVSLVLYTMEKGELKMMILTVFVLGFCFSYRNLLLNKIGVGGLIVTTVLVAISVAFHEFAHRELAHRYGTEIEFKTWNSLLFGALAIAIVTDGLFVFAALWVIIITPVPLLRPRHKYPHVGPWESAKIVAAGPMANFALALVAAIITFRTGSALWNQLMIMNFWIAGMNLIPFFRFVPLILMGQGGTWLRIGSKIWAHTKNPYMEGEMIFFGSRMFGMFLLMLVSVTALIVLILHKVFLGLFVGLLFGIGIWLFMEYYIEPGAQQSVPERLKIWKKL